MTNPEIEKCCDEAFEARENFVAWCDHLASKHIEDVLRHGSLLAGQIAALSPLTGAGVTFFVCLWMAASAARTTTDEHKLPAMNRDEFMSFAGRMFDHQSGFADNCAKRQAEYDLEAAKQEAEARRARGVPFQ